MVIKDPKSDNLKLIAKTRAVAKTDKVGTADGGPEDLDPLED